MNTCRAKGCRFSNTHVTLGHRCGKCNLFGHGVVECGKLNNILSLRNISRNDKISENARCDVQDCLHKWSHIKSAHHCKKCSERGHSTSNCPQSRRYDSSRNDLGIFSRWENYSPFFSEDDEDDEIESSVVESTTDIQHGSFSDYDKDSERAALSKMGSIDGKIYVTIPSGMGCSFWYRRASRYTFLERLFIHSDDWGQYGPGRVSQHTSFINGYVQI